jgi:hypothetical protein
MRRLLHLAITCLLLASLRLASAAPSRVVLVRSSGGELVEEATNRLRAELLAAGFEVRIDAVPADVDPRSAVERAARETGAFAAVIVSPSSGGTAADIWVTDRVTGKTSVRTVEVNGTTAAADLAVRAADLLKASLLEATADTGRARPPAPADVQRWVQPTPPPKPPRPENPPPPSRPPERRPFFTGLVLEAGGGLLYAPGGIGPAGCPALRLSYALRNGFGLRLGVVGPAIGAALESSVGTATVRQELGSLEVFHAFDVHPSLVPVVSLGGGAYHLHASGAPLPPYIGASGEIWAGLLTAGVGGAYRLTDRVALTLDMRGLLTAPRPVVTLAGQEIGSAGRPSILWTAGVLVSLH